jgi:hypothetical protein
MRPWREYAASLARLYAMEDAARPADAPPLRRPAPWPNLWVEWWFEQFTLLRDCHTRRYPYRLVTFDALLRDPRSVVSATLSWLGHDGVDVDAAVTRVRPQHRTQEEASEPPDVPARLAELFDALYDAVDTTGAVPRELLVRLNAAAPELEERLGELRSPDP